jgi:hypothetical protein
LSLTQVQTRFDARFVPPYARDWRELEPVRRWRERVSPNTFPTYFGYLYRFLHSIGKDPATAILWARESPDKYDVLDAIQNYVVKLEGRRYKTKESGYAALRSYFQHNRIMLPRDPGFQIRSDQSPVERKLTIDHLRELIGLATQPFRSMILVKWMGLLDNEGLIYVSNNCAAQVVKALTENQSVLRFDLPGRKRSKNIRPFYTFISHDALESLKEYFERDRGYPKPGEPIWLYGNPKRPVNKVGIVHAWLRLLRRARLIPREIGNRTTRYGYNIHNTRDLAISLLNTVSGLNPLCIEFWAGHDIDKLGYNQFYSIKPDYVSEQYQLADTLLNIISNPAALPSKETTREIIQEEVRRILKEQGPELLRELAKEA